MDAREVALKCAIAELNSGVRISQRALAKKWGVPRFTLQERVKGRSRHAIAHSYQQQLTPEREKFLVK
jgi:hypothetical protein